MADPVPLSIALKERSATVCADPDGFVAGLASGRGCRDDYVAMVAQLWFIYGALEEAAERMRRDAVASVFISDALTRLPALEADLDHLLGPRWRDRIVAVPATVQYVSRIRTVASTWAGGFVAHHYTRCLGDLSGGPVLGRVLQRRFGFDTNGAGFYLFDAIADPKRFKDVYREQLDAVAWDERERERVIEEVLVAYRCNTAVFEELSRRSAAA